MTPDTVRDTYTISVTSLADRGFVENTSFLIEGGLGIHASHSETGDACSCLVVGGWRRVSNGDADCGNTAVLGTAGFALSHDRYLSGFLSTCAYAPTRLFDFYLNMVTKLETLQIQQEFIGSTRVPARILRRATQPRRRGSVGAIFLKTATATPLISTTSRLPQEGIKKVCGLSF